jgi:hypothetical protein
MPSLTALLAQIVLTAGALGGGLACAAFVLGSLSRISRH